MDGLRPDCAYRFRLVRLVRERPAANSEEKSEQEEQEEKLCEDSDEDSLVLSTVGPKVKVATLRETLFTLDASCAGENLALSNGNATVTNLENKKWNACKAQRKAHWSRE